MTADTPMKRLRILLGFSLAPALLVAAAPAPPPNAFLENHCYDCHGEDAQKGGLRLDTLGRDLKNPEDSRRWEKFMSASLPGRCRRQNARASLRPPSAHCLRSR